MRPLALLLAAFVPLACSSKSNDAPAPPPVTTTLGGLGVRLELDPLRIVVSDAAGRVLFDGLPPKDIDAPTDDADPPPITGLAVRDVTTTVQALYGSYQFTDAGTKWRVAKRAANVKVGDGLSFDAIDDGGAKIASVAILGQGTGEVSIQLTPASTSPQGARTWASIGASCDDADRFLGFGAQQRDIEFRGQVVPIFVSEPGIGKRDDDAPLPIWYLAGARHASSYPVPLYLARRGYVGALDAPGRSFFGMCAEENALRVTGDADAAPGRTFTFRIFAGATPKEALGRSTARFGRPRVPPRLAFAPWNDAIFGSTNVRAFAKFLRDHDIPSSAIWTEDFRGGDFVGDDYKLKEEWDPDPTLYPDLQAMIGDLHGEGFAWFAYYNTFVENDVKVWSETQPKGYLVAKTDGSTYTFTNAKQRTSGLLDLTNPDAKAFMASKMKSMLALGADGWMGDYGEWTPLDGKLFDGSDPWATHDLYPQLWQEAQRAALDADDLGATASPKARRLAFVRSGWLRTPPLADVVWGGDQSTDFKNDDGMPTVIPLGLGLGIAGVSTYGHDIAGYQSALTSPADKETFFRWTELGAWTPVMRTHHGTQPKKQWMLQSDDESTQHWRRYAILHQQLLPVWEALAQQAHDTGVSIWRQLAVEQPDDEDAWRVIDEFMVGPSILVAPVVTKGATSRKVYLPKGADWVPWNGGAKAAGGTTISVDAALGEVPVFVKAGSVVAMLPDTVRSVIAEATGMVRAEDVGDDRVVRAFAGGSGDFVESAGLAYHVTAGATGSGTTWNGAALAACGSPIAAPCLETTAHGAIAHVTGPGKLVSEGTATTVDIQGGAPTRKLTIELVAH